MERSRGANTMVRAIANTAHNVTTFQKSLEDRGVLETSKVAIMSDHLAMPNTLKDELRQFADQRRNFFVLLGYKEGQVITRPATTLDIFPTLMESLGYQLQNGRANLGVSLLSETPILMEQSPLSEINKSLSANNALRRILLSAGEPRSRV